MESVFLYEIYFIKNDPITILYSVTAAITNLKSFQLQLQEKKQKEINKD